MLSTPITDHVQQALARQMTQYKALRQQYLMTLYNTPAYIPTGTYSPIHTAAPTSHIGFGYGSLVGLAQAFQVASPLDIGQITVPFAAKGTVSDGLVTAYLYIDNGHSPSIHAAPTGQPIAQAVEVYNAAALANAWVAGGSTGFISKTFTFDFNFAPGYYWVVLSSNFSASVGNSLLVGLNNTGGLAFANGFYAGQDITGYFGANGASGSAQLAFTVAEKVSAPPLQPSNAINVSGVGILIASEADQVQAIENTLNQINSGRQLFNGTSYPAQGAQLDGIGQIVGIARNGLSDAEYLVFILGKIGENYSNGTLPDVTNIIGLVFQTPTFTLIPFYPAEVNLQIPATSGLPPSLYSTAVNIGEKSISAGIGVGFASVYPANPFLCGAVGKPSVGGGFGALADPGGGGGLAANFYENFGA
jgi:hypothetical protein